jgi:hypothetical protein
MGNAIDEANAMLFLTGRDGPLGPNHGDDLRCAQAILGDRGQCRNGETARLIRAMWIYGERRYSS